MRALILGLILFCVSAGYSSAETTEETNQIPENTTELSEAINYVKAVFDMSNIGRFYKEEVRWKKSMSGASKWAGGVLISLGAFDEAIMKVYGVPTAYQAWALFELDFAKSFRRFAIKFTKVGSPRYEKYVKLINRADKLKGANRYVPLYNSNGMNRLFRFGRFGVGSSLLVLGIFLDSEFSNEGAALDEYYESLDALMQTVMNNDPSEVLQLATEFNSLRIQILTMASFLHSLDL